MVAISIASILDLRYLMNRSDEVIMARNLFWKSADTSICNTNQKTIAILSSTCRFGLHKEPSPDVRQAHPDVATDVDL